MKMIMIAGLLAAGVLFGKDVVLKNADEPFIDLAQSVVDSERGMGGIEEAGLSESETEPETEAVVKPTEAPVVVEVRIEVRDRTITVNGVKCSDADDMITRAGSIYKSGMQVILVDDYAELHTYKDVRDRLADEGYEFTEEAS